MENINILGELYILKNNSLPFKNQDESQPILQLFKDNIGFYLYNDSQKSFKAYIEHNFINRFADNLLDVLNNSNYVGTYAINTKGKSNDFIDNKHLILYQNPDYIITYNENYDNDNTDIPIKVFKSDIKDWVMLNEQRKIFKDRKELYKTVYINNINNSFGNDQQKLK